MRYLPEATRLDWNLGGGGSAGGKEPAGLARYAFLILISLLLEEIVPRMLGCLSCLQAYESGCCLDIR